MADTVIMAFIILVHNVRGEGRSKLKDRFHLLDHPNMMTMIIIENSIGY